MSAIQKLKKFLFRPKTITPAFKYRKFQYRLCPVPELGVKIVCGKTMPE
jgi:hypothetical protein